MTTTAPDFGVDLDWRDDLNPTGRLVSGIELLGQAAFHRLHTPRGSSPDAPDDGLDLAEYLSRGMTPAELAGIPGDISSELRKDERFLDADVSFTQDAPASFKFKIVITPSAGPTFALVISVEQAAMTLISVTEVSA